MYSLPKKIISMLLLTSIIISLSPVVLALGYSGSQKNTSTFETLEETRISSPLAVAGLETNEKKTFKSHPVLDEYPQGTTFIYRSANMFGGRAAARLNTNLLVFADKKFDNKDSAKAYLADLGLLELIDAAIGSVILITPIDSEAGYGLADQKAYYGLQTAMLAQKASERNGDVVTYYSDAEYFGGFGYLYAIAVNEGATFFNNYIATVFDYASRLAGVLLINGDINKISNIASLLPAYLVNAPAEVIEKYKCANNTDAKKGNSQDSTITYFNQSFPVQQVIVDNKSDGVSDKLISKVYEEMFIHTMRIPVRKQGLSTAGTPYQGYNFDQAPYSLSKRNPVVNNVTHDGISVIMRQESRFSDIDVQGGEYLETWFEYVPNEVLRGEVPDGTVPLILANHGSGDDPRLFVDETGWLSLIGEERLILVAPEHQYVTQEARPYMLSALVNYMLETYPEIDRTRVYVTGYSMGGRATVVTATGNPSLFAAAVCMSGPTAFPDEFRENFKEVDLPFMYLISRYDSPSRAVDANGNLHEQGQILLNEFLAFNNMSPLTFDFNEYPISGFSGDRWSQTLLNNEYINYNWMQLNDRGAPMVALSYIEELIHCLYPEYAQMSWKFMKQFTRNQSTGEIIYNPSIH